MATSLTVAQIEYIPYVGGQINILSFPGTQTQRNNMSILSSDPTPRHKFSIDSFLLHTCLGVVL